MFILIAPASLLTNLRRLFFFCKDISCFPYKKFSDGVSRHSTDDALLFSPDMLQTTIKIIATTWYFATTGQLLVLPW